MNLTYDELFGVTLTEYLKEHNTNLTSIIEKIEIDIMLLKKNLKNIISMNGILDSKIDIIYKTINKKEKHLNRLIEWSKGNIDD
jgi:hypothetical protein